MAIGSQSLTLNIVADDRVLKRVLADAKRNVTTFSKDVEKAGVANQAALGGVGFFGRGSKGNQALRGIASGTGLGSAALFGSGAFIGAAISAAAIKKSVDAASDLNEQITKTQQVFGDASKAVLDWSKTTTDSIFISQKAALEAASTFGNLFSAQGFNNAKSSQLSKNLVQLAGDLASFNNIDVTQVLQDLQSGIVGEIEPVRKYGADLRIARVQQEALAETGKSVVKQLTQQELTLARLSLLYRDTKKAQGDAARTAGGLANQERKLSAEVQDLEANLGALLTPAVTLLVTQMNDLLDVAVKVTSALKTFANIKIPTIHLPFKIDLPGGRIGGAIKEGAGFLPPFNIITIVKKLHEADKKGFEQFTAQDQPKLAADLTNVFNGYFGNAINTALKDTNVVPTAGFGDTFAAGLKSFLESTRDKVQAAIGKTKAGIATVNLVDSLQLGVEKSQISGSLAAQLAALETLKGGIEKQIKQGIDVKNAQHQLVAVETQIADLQQQIKQDGIDKILGALQLGVDRAALTKGLGDDLKALEAQRDGILAQIKVGNDVQNNQSQLVSVMQAIAAKKQEIAQKASDALQAKQFRALGLSASGDEIVPGLKNLSTRIDQTLNKVSSGELKISSKLASRLRSARRLIVKEGDNLKNATRQKIDEFIKAANGGDSKNKLTGPLTKTTSLNTNKVLEGLGLDATAAKELKARLSNFNSAGVGLSAGVAASASGVAFGAGVPNVIVNVELDGQKVAKSVTVHQQKRARSNPPQKRGPNAGRN